MVLSLPFQLVFLALGLAVAPVPTVKSLQGPNALAYLAGKSLTKKTKFMKCISVPVLSNLSLPQLIPCRSKLERLSVTGTPTKV
jgi:hypothetical protein